MDLSQRLLEAARKCAGETALAALAQAGASPIEQIKSAGLNKADLARCVGEAVGIQFISDLAERPPSATFLEKVPIAFARQHKMLGLASNNGHLPVAVSS